MAAKVFSVENRKGGVAKTTTAVILATALAQKGRTLLVDTDPQGNAAHALGVNAGGRCLSQLLLEEADYKDVVMQGWTADGPERRNLFLIPASDRLTSAVAQLVEGIGAMKDIAEKMPTAMRRNNNPIPTIADYFHAALDPLKTHFSYIILDCPPSLGELRAAIHSFAHYAIVPTRTEDYLSVRQTTEHTQNILDDQKGGGSVRLLAVVPTFVQANHSLTREMMNQLRQAYGRLLTSPIPLTTAVASATATGKGYTILDTEPGHKASEAYQTLINRVLAV